jgi:inner membrane protein
VTVPVSSEPDKRRIGRPYLSYAISDVQGLASASDARIDGRSVTVAQGVGDGLSGEGMHVPLGPLGMGQRRQLEAKLDLTLAGTESLGLAPLGNQNLLTLSSSWPHPSFEGRSPRKRDISARGFSATWNIPGLASTAQRRFLEGSPGSIDAVRVSLVEPVDVYAKTERATKYGLLFVLLTFVGFFLFEVTKELPIHPIQYGLVGLALALFFLLLLSLSEHIAFGWSYLAAGAASVGLIAFYLTAVLRSALRALGFGAMLASLYGALYGVLLSEDNALVLGALLLFAALATLMAVTRKVDWYRFSKLPSVGVGREPIA